MKDIRKYDLVVLHHTQGAVIFRVIEVMGINVLVQDIDGLNAPQTVDRSLLFRPTNAQRKANSIGIA